MAIYKEIKGSSVQNFSSDPANPIAGQVWYNSTSNELKVSDGPVVSAWATANDLNTGRYTLAGAGTQTAALGFGGNPTTAVTESYNGTNWTEVNDLNTARRQLAGCGANNTAALAFGGSPSPVRTAITETWNGTNWTEVNDLNLARNKMAGAGTNTAALAFGGQPSTAVTELWNGTNWTEVNDLNTARFTLAGCGANNTAALAIGGEAAAATGATELWNGTNWTEVNDLNVARYNLAGAGTNTAALAFGGQQLPRALTEEFSETGGTRTISTE